MDAGMGLPCPAKDIFLGPSVGTLGPNFKRLSPESVTFHRTPQGTLRSGGDWEGPHFTTDLPLDLKLTELAMVTHIQ